MKWETIKQQVGGQLRESILRGSGESYSLILVDLVDSNFAAKRGKASFEVITLYADKAQEVIDHWDVRMVGRLRELFPDFFPRSLKHGPLIAEYDDAGDWQVYKKEALQCN